MREFTMGNILVRVDDDLVARFREARGFSRELHSLTRFKEIGDALARQAAYPGAKTFGSWFPTSQA